MNEPSQVPQVDNSKQSSRMPSARERRRWKQLENLAKAPKVFTHQHAPPTSLPTYLPTENLPQPTYLHLPYLPTYLSTYLPNPTLFHPTLTIPYLPYSNLPYPPTYLPYLRFQPYTSVTFYIYFSLCFPAIRLQTPNAWWVFIKLSDEFQCR